MPLKQLLRIPMAFFRGRSPKNPSPDHISGETRQHICEAFDSLLANSARCDNLNRAQFAIRLNEIQCGPTAQYVVQYLCDKGLHDFKLHSLRGHYVILHSSTDLIFDIETYEGIPLNQAHLLSISIREQQAQTLFGQSGADNQLWQERWVNQRKSALIAAQSQPR